MEEGKREIIRKELLQMFAPGYRFPLQDTDDELKVEIKNMASFGDLKEASASCENCPANNEGICTLRKFFLGRYKVTVMRPYKPDQFEDDDGDPLVLFHHEKVDPNLIMLQVIRFGGNYLIGFLDHQYCIGRHDWMCELGCDDSDYDLVKAKELVVNLLKKDLKEDVQVTVPPPYQKKKDLKEDVQKKLGDFNNVIFLADAEKASEMDKFIMKKQIHQSSFIQNLCSVQNDSGETVSLGVNYTPYDWEGYVYGKLFVDSYTDACFALVVNATAYWHGPWEEVLTKEELKDLGFTDEPGLKFPMSDFIINDS